MQDGDSGPPTGCGTRRASGSEQGRARSRTGWAAWTAPAGRLEAGSPSRRRGPPPSPMPGPTPEPPPLPKRADQEPEVVPFPRFQHCSGYAYALPQRVQLSPVPVVEVRRQVGRRAVVHSSAIWRSSVMCVLSLMDSAVDASAASLSCEMCVERSGVRTSGIAGRPSGTTPWERSSRNRTGIWLAWPNRRMTPRMSRRRARR